MNYQKDDCVVVMHPDYPELQGLATIKNKVVSTIIQIEFCDGKGSFTVHSEYVRLATQEEIDSYMFDSEVNEFMEKHNCDKDTAIDEVCKIWKERCVF